MSTKKHRPTAHDFCNVCGSFEPLWDVEEYLPEYGLGIWECCKSCLDKKRGSWFTDGERSVFRTHSAKEYDLGEQHGGQVPEQIYNRAYLDGYKDGELAKKNYFKTEAS